MSESGCDPEDRRVPDVATRRVLLLDMPRLLCDLVRDVLSEQPDLEVVAELHDDSQLDEAVTRTAPNFVIVGTDRAELSEACKELFELRPRLKVLALATEGGRSVVWELAPNYVQLGEMSPESLLAALRQSRPWRWQA
jgi:DNA-binding NarL/FixJ family response regulator